MIEFYQSNYKTKLAAAGLLAPMTLALASCGSAETATDTETSVITETMTTTPSNSLEADQRKSQYKIIFDYLNAGSHVVDVYSSPMSATKSGTFYDGQSAPAYCQTAGREITSAPGETPVRDSDKWIKIMTNVTNNDSIYYASAVYIEDPDTVLAELPEC